LEQYLRVFCRTQQNNWHAWLPLAQYTKNSWPSATTKKTPYDLLIGYTPQVHQPTQKTTIPSLEQRLLSIEEARKAAQEAQRKAQESWIKEKPRYVPFIVGSKVWLEGTNLRLPSNTTPKLSPRRYGPFKVVSQISKVAYKLELPSTWKIHDVFHASLLTPYKETDQHGPNFIEPPPDILEGEPKWEVEKILKERSFGRWKKKQYLVRWKGYSPAHDSWTNSEDLHAPELLADFQNQSRSIRTLQLDDPTSSLLCPVTSPSLTIKAMSTNENSAPSTLVNASTGTATSPFSRRSSPQDMPLAIVGPLDNNVAMDTSSPVRTPLMVTLGGLPDPLATSPSLVSQSLTPPLPIPPPTFLAPPPVTEHSTSPSQRLLALADATVNATTSPLPFDNRSPNPPLSSIPTTPNPSPSRPLTPVVLRHTRSPLPSFFRNRSQSPPLEYQETPLMIFGIGTPTQEDIKDVRKNCRALLRAMETHQRLESALEAWTEGLMPAINILGNDGIEDTVFTTSFRDFSAIQHLFFVPQILSEVEPFLDSDSIQSDPPESLGARYHPTISQNSSPSPITINPPLSDELNDPTYPGEGWALFDAGNPGHYPLTFVNNEGQSEVAKYICFRSTEEDTYLVGT